MADVTLSAGASEAPNSERPPILAVHHTAIRCHDAEETRRFYEGVLGLPLSAAEVFDHNGLEPIDFMHLFFRMADGDFLAFFDAPADLRPNFFRPFGRADFRQTLSVPTEAELLSLAARLSTAGVPYTGPVDNGLSKSIYFKDPNGIHTEIAVITPDYSERLAEEKKRARDVLAAWQAKTAAQKDSIEKSKAPA